MNSDSDEMQDYDIMKQFDKCGLETVIVEQKHQSSQNNNTSKQQQSPVIFGQPSLIKITSSFDNQMDYSGLYTKHSKTKVISNKQNTRIRQACQITVDIIRTSKAELNQIRDKLQQMASSYQSSFKQFFNKLKNQFQTTINGLKQRNCFLEQKNTELIQRLNNAKEELENKQTQVKQIQLQIIKIMQANQYHFKNQGSSAFSNRQVNNHELAPLENNTMNHQSKMYSSQSRFKNSNYHVDQINQQNMEMKKKYVMMMERFSQEINKLENDISKLRSRQNSKNQHFTSWERQLETKQYQMNNIVETIQSRQKDVEIRQIDLQARQNDIEQQYNDLQTRQNDIERQQNYLQARQQKLKIKQKQINQRAFSRQKRLNEEISIKHHRRFSSFTQFVNSPTYKQQHQIKNKSNFVSKPYKVRMIKEKEKQRNLGINYSFSTSALRYLQNKKSLKTFGDQNIKVHKPLNISHPSETRKYIEKTYGNNTLNNRILTIQDSLKNQLKSMGYNL